MANQKKTLLVFTSVDADVLRNGSAASLEKLRFWVKSCARRERSLR